MREFRRWYNNLLYIVQKHVGQKGARLVVLSQGVMYYLISQVNCYFVEGKHLNVDESKREAPRAK